MKKVLPVIVAALVVTAAAPALAALNGLGVTGVVNSPTAGSVAPMTLSVAADYVNADDFLVPVRVGFGVIEGLEVGATYTYVDNDAVDGVFGGGAKYTLPLELAEGLAVAAGGHYLLTKTDFDDISTLIGYGVATYRMDLEGIGLAASGGMDFERMSNGSSESGIGFFASIEVRVMEGLAVLGEFTSDHGDIKDDSTSLLVRYELPMVEGLTVQAGLTEIGDDHELLVGAEYAFSLGM